MKFILSKYNNSKIFLIDASGAFVSIILLLFLHSFDEYFGMPKNILSIFLGIAIILLSYSAVIYLINSKRWRAYLKAVATLNMCYCAFTIYQVFLFFENITLYGKLYFVGEVLVIIILSVYELKIAANNRI